jgi:hypothetical protein
MSIFDVTDEPGNIPELRLSLRIRGDELDPDLITQHLGVAPTFAVRQGDASCHDGATRTRSEGVWVYRLSAAPDTELGELVEMLLAPFPTDINLWEELMSTYSADVLCGVYIEGSHQGTSLSVEALTRLGRLGLSLNFEFHLASSKGGREDDDS